jgi:hypothetical protein
MQRVERLPDGTQIIKIAPDSKWAVLLPETVDKQTAGKWADIVAEWWAAKDTPFMLFISDVQLVRLDEAESG